MCKCVQLVLSPMLLLSMLVSLSHTNPPIIHYSHNMRILKIPVNTQVGDIIYRIRASDADNDTITFDVLEDYGKSVLVFKSLNPNEANVILNKQLETTEAYNLTIYASDAKESTYIESIVMGTSSPSQPGTPILVESNPVYVFENATLNTSLALVRAYDRDDSKLPVTFELLDQNDLFALRYIFGPRGMSTAELVLNNQLNYELQNLYILTILALNAKTDEEVDTRNIHSIRLSVIVKDVQDTPPIFFNLPQVISLDNTYQVNEIIFNVSAEDGDTWGKRDITYTLNESDGEYFQINKQGNLGPIVPFDQLSRAYATDQPLRLEIQANEIVIGGEIDQQSLSLSTATAELIIMFNFTNRPPRFTWSSTMVVGTIDEHSQLGTPVRWLPTPDDSNDSLAAEDYDLGLNGTLSLEVIDPMNMFDIEPKLAYQSTTFTLVVNDIKQLDYEMRHNLTAVIIVTDNSRENRLNVNITCTILINDRNDHSPQFGQDIYEASIMENAEIGTVVTAISATDQDSGEFGQIAYTNIKGTFAQNFNINPENGTITLISREGIDREMVSKFVLTIEARDQRGKGNSNTAEVHITVLDVNDNPPIFLQPFYLAMINPEDRSLIHPLQVNAIDIDEPNTLNSLVNYEILHGNYDEIFQIDRISGNVSLDGSRGKSFDKLQWQPNSVNLTIRAFDMGIPQMSSVINVFIFFMNRSKRIRTLFVTNNKLDLTHSVAFFENILNGITGGIVKLDEFKHHDIRKKRSPHIAIVTSVEYGNETIVNLDKLSSSYNELFYNDTPVETISRYREDMEVENTTIEPIRKNQSISKDSSVSWRTFQTSQLDGTVVLLALMILFIFILFLVLIYLLCLICKGRKKQKEYKRKSKKSKTKRNAIANQEDTLTVVHSNNHDHQMIMGEATQGNSLDHTIGYVVKEEKKYTKNGDDIITYSEYKHIRCPKASDYAGLNSHIDSHNNIENNENNEMANTHQTIPKLVDGPIQVIDAVNAAAENDNENKISNQLEVINKQYLPGENVDFGECFEPDGSPVARHKKSIFTITYDNICKRDTISSGSEQS